MADFTVDDLAEMMALLDKDGNQDVSKEEFKEYCERAMGIASDAFEKMWKMIDNNGDGILQFSELCEYFGVSVGDAESGARAKKEMRIGTGARVGVTVIKKDSSGSEFDFMEACEMIEPKVDRDKAMELLGWKPPPDPGVLGTWETPKVNVRIEDPEKREMPLHKLARNHEFQMVKRVYEIVLNDPKSGKDIATADMNSQNKDGKTPLMIAVEGNIAYLNSIEGDAEKIQKYRDKQVKTVDLILSCTADMYAESTTNNWNVLHCAAHGGSYEAAQSIFMYMVKHAFSTLAVRMLVNHPDKDGRTPLHVAAMRCDQASLDPPFVQLLLNKGADPLIKDTCPQALTAAALAEKANRPNAKAMLDKAAEVELAQRAAYRSRRKSMSRELP
ncbi:ankyrin repeat protein [Chrysochromulina tobinii]|uniref:Ankyrin repeat protein n=1 Tax=Chrysochromulina tobinii TaxID=1460289 RepID=A0A0M0JHP6_9EUKA|nr:ankyrin repeat protein [Chrysochromulina tobinii]|eukprot:KOO26121.1 ankyrin repeat protein [Chrysochromulina sp. CCMP291]